MKTKIYALTAISMFIISGLAAQALKTKQISSANSLSPLADGNHFIISGEVISKVDDQLNSLWSRQIIDTTSDETAYFTHALELGDGSIFVCGYEFHGLYCYGIFVKLDQDGNMIWIKAYQREGLHSGMQPDQITQLPDGDIVMIGKSGAGPIPDRIMWLKADTGGNILAYSEIFSMKDYTPVNIFPLADNSSVIACYYGNISIASDNAFPRMLKVDANGNVTQWIGYGFMLGSSMTDCIRIADGYLISGMNKSAAYLMKIDTAFNFIWKKTYPDSILSLTTDVKDNGFQSLTKWDDTSYLIAGTFPSDNITYAPFYARTDSDGNVLFSNRMDGPLTYLYDCLMYDHPVLLGQGLLFNIDGAGVSACPNTAVPLPATIDTLIFIRNSPHTVESITDSLLNHEYVISDFGTDSILCEQVFQNIPLIEHSRFEVYPNPADEFVTMQIPVDGKIFIYNIDGIEVMHLDVSNAGTVNVETGLLSSGLYEVLLRTDNGRMLSEKLMVSH